MLSDQRHKNDSSAIDFIQHRNKIMSLRDPSKAESNLAINHRSQTHSNDYLELTNIDYHIHIQNLFPRSKSTHNL